jgi:hypothetical protein
VIKFHGISMPEGAALSWPLSDIVIRRKNGFDFRCRVRGCSLLDQRPVSAHRRHSTAGEEGLLSTRYLTLACAKLKRFGRGFGQFPP